MAVSSRGRMTELGVVSRKWKDREISPERNRVWIEPKPHNDTINNNNNKKSFNIERKVAVVYYLSRNGQLDHPHFIEVPLSSNDGLYLEDVINRLNLLRGKGMASLYSWSSKRSYRNGYVWHDLAENDFIYPSHGQEYVLKGSEIQILDHSINPQSMEITSSSFPLTKRPESQKTGNEHDFPSVRRRRNQSWSSIDLQEYKVYKAESSSESARRLAADASTQTEDKRRRKKPVVKQAEIEELRSQSQSQELEMNQTTELVGWGISPTMSDSSPETLESLIKVDGRLRLRNGGGNEDSLNRTAENCPSGRMKPSSVLMQLISCGSISFKNCGPNSERNQGFSLIGHYKSRLRREAENRLQLGKEAGIEREIGSFSRVRLEDKEYFSGSLIETKKQEVPALKRSSSYNADRSSQLQLAEKEKDGVHAKCIPRKLETLSMKKEGNIITDSSGESGSISQTGSKRHDR
ncbi:protein UPSTREAM OF FLC-like [Durio zibethinus]|uniref:Protein UPSTREAM OF FLC-like n=1 Tax=Durio zibethinus TaxID=66656 RepID=A0A6P5ZIU8_DURZI|nr:protein UPSTREAM OF FLC-like [Durio zibethinus]XP_022752788.1 protein UPSTREAM OF FLC-like [Durio zibethinus]